MKLTPFPWVATSRVYCASGVGCATIGSSSVRKILTGVLSSVGSLSSPGFRTNLRASRGETSCPIPRRSACRGTIFFLGDRPVRGPSAWFPSWADIASFLRSQQVSCGLGEGGEPEKVVGHGRHHVIVPHLIRLDQDGFRTDGEGRIDVASEAVPDHDGR